MAVNKLGILGFFVSVLIGVGLACQCTLPVGLTDSYCHRLADQTERIALIKAEICHKEMDDGFAEHFMVIKEVYLEPRFFRIFPGPPQTIMPDYFSTTPSCATVPRLHSYTQGPGQTMLLTSSGIRGDHCGIPTALNPGFTYVMEVLYYGAQWDITSCSYHKVETMLTQPELASLRLFKSLQNQSLRRTNPLFPPPVPPTCPSDPPPGAQPNNRRWK